MTPTERQRERRRRMREAGWLRLDVAIPPELWRRLEPCLKTYCPYDSQGFPGYALVRWLNAVLPKRNTGIK